MSMQNGKHLRLILFAFALTSVTQAAELSWTAGDGIWQNGANWSNVLNGGWYFGPPRHTDHAVISNDGGNVVSLNEDTAGIDGLYISNGNQLSTNGHQLRLDNAFDNANLRVSGSDSRLDVYERAADGASVSTNILSLEDSGQVWLRDPDAHVEVQNLVTIASGSRLVGNGSLLLGTPDTEIGDRHIQNQGTIEVATFGAFGAGTATLRIDAFNQDDHLGLLDLDGPLGTGVLDVDGDSGGDFNQLTLEVNANPLSFSGLLQIGQADTARFNRFFTTTPEARIELRGGQNAPATFSSISAINYSEIILHSGIGIFEGRYDMLGGSIDIAAGSTLELRGDFTLHKHPAAESTMFSSTGTFRTGEDSRLTIGPDQYLPMVVRNAGKITPGTDDPIRLGVLEQESTGTLSASFQPDATAADYNIDHTAHLAGTLDVYVFPHSLSWEPASTTTMEVLTAESVIGEFDVEPERHQGYGVFVDVRYESNRVLLDVFKAIPGDANGDGIFNSTDLVQVFVAGQYEDDVEGNSTWLEGDWNRDWDFDSGDLVAAFAYGGYTEASAVAATHSVPEPASLCLTFLGILTMIRPYRASNG